MPDAPLPAPQNSTGSGEASHPAQGQPGVDVQRLADKVYDLLLADARLGRARGDSSLIAQRTGEG